MPVSGLNPEILRWARELAGLTTAEVAALVHRDIETVESWETGESAPTYAQLEALAYRVFKRPLALFFFPEPPEEPTPEHSFRTLPAFEIGNLDADTRYRVRDARALQLALYELHEGVNPSPRKIFRDLAIERRDIEPRRAADATREYLGITLDDQTRFRSVEDALSKWRSSVEDAGVYVFKNTFQQREVSGFCLFDPEFPIIYINNSSAKTRQIFTLFHELAHVLLGTSSVTKVDDRYIGRLPEDAKAIEVFCNRFAADFLVPEADLRRRIEGLPITDDVIVELANTYRVSREFILRRYLDLGLVSPQYYHEQASEWNQQFEEGQRSEGGGNYYNTQAAYMGGKFLELAFRRYYQGAISVQQLADYLGVKAKNVPSLEQTYLQRAGR